IAFHFRKAARVSRQHTPLFYGLAMAAGAFSHFLFGRLFDRIGFTIFFIAFLVGAVFAPFVCLGQCWMALIGMAVWGIAMGAQNSLLKAVLTGVMWVSKRSTGFGVFYACFGIA